MMWIITQESNKIHLGAYKFYGNRDYVLKSFFYIKNNLLSKLDFLMFYLINPTFNVRRITS